MNDNDKRRKKLIVTTILIIHANTMDSLDCLSSPVPVSNCS